MIAFDFFRRETELTTPNQTGQRRVPTPEEFVETQRSAEFKELRSKMRGFTFPVTIAGLSWYAVYILMAMYAPDFMGIELWGRINVGFVFGLLQFVTTFMITWIYVRYSDKNIEPRAARVREMLEGTPAPASAAGA